MQIYLELTKRSFINTITYRAELFLWLILDSIPFLVLLLVWTAIFQNTSEINSYSLSDITQYYLLVLLIDGVSSSHFEQYRVQQIRDGKIDHYLLRPISYLAEIFFVHVGNKIFYTCIALPFFLTMYYLFSLLFPIEKLSVSTDQVIGFIILLILATLVEFFLGLIIVLLGFWFEYSEGLEHFKWIVISLFSGSLFPIALMPEWLARITELLPFKYMYSIPIGVLQNTHSLGFTDIIRAASLPFSLLILSLIIWRRAQKQYSSAGG